MKYAQSRLSRIVCLICLLAVTGAAYARSVTVTLKDGSKFTGELISESPNSVTILLQDGLEKSWSRQQVQSVVQQPLSVADEYKVRKSRVKDDDINGRYELARWLYDQKSPEAHELSLKELDAILKLNPDHLQANFLKSAIKSAEEKRKAAETPTPTAPGTPQEDPPAAPASPGEPLTEEQINLLRVYEVNLASRPRIFISNDDVDAFLAAYRQDPMMERFVGRDGERRFKTLQSHQQLEVIFNLRARDFYPKVQIRDEPETLKTYKQLVHNNYLIAFCAKCHSEGKAAGLDLITDRRTADSTLYTNLVRTAMTRTAGLPMLVQPDSYKSPLLQYGLPREEALTPHPEVQGFKAYFNSTKDPRFAQMVRWVEALSAQTVNPTEIFPEWAQPGPAAAPTPTANN